MNGAFQLTGYRIIDVKAENEQSKFYRAYSIEKEEQVLIQMKKSSEPEVKEDASAIYGYYISEKLTKGTLQPIEMIHADHKYFFIYAYFEGITLEEWLKNHPRTGLLDAMKIAYNIATAISYIHQQEIIHKNINPMNILISEKTLEVRLIGLNYATMLKQENTVSAFSPGDIEGTLSYVSPEQTGRMNRSIDERTDMYALGVTLYQLFTGKLPFTEMDPLQLIHAHLAKEPKSPVLLRKDLPEQIANIIMKLIKKTAEDRYRSAWGVREDFENCLIQYRTYGYIGLFPAGRHDYRDYFETARRLYGREREFSSLHLLFDKVKEGALGISFIRGDAGIGKTALVNEIQKPLIKEKGYFISGKFDQLQRIIPFAPIISAFQTLTRQIITGNNGEVDKWRLKLETGMEGHAGLICSMIPELKWLLGDEPLVQIGSSEDSQKRLFYVWGKFIQVFATKEHPVVLFLDDLQWADIASLELIEYLILNKNCQYLMIIGVYRHQEIHTQHPLQKTFQLLKENKIDYLDIYLKSLTEDVVEEWLKESLRDEGQHINGLSMFLHRITAGNPFYTKQLLQSFYDDGHIQLDMNTRKWMFRYNEAEKYQFSEDVVKFIASRILLLPASTQQVLKLASCIGNKFDLKTLAIISKLSYKETASLLWPALETGMILPNDVWYKWIYPQEEMRIIDEHAPLYTFLHDKVQQAVYSTMTESEKEMTHLTIGRLLVQQSDVMSERLFDTVYHLNISRKQLTLTECMRLKEMNIFAGERAKASSAYNEALAYFETANALAPPQWEKQYELTYRLMRGLSECQYLTSHFSEAEATMKYLHANVRSKEERLEVYNLQMILYTHMHQLNASLESGLAGLALFDIKFSAKITKLQVAKELLLLKKELLPDGCKKISTLPQMANENKRKVLYTMITMNAASYHADQNLAALLMLKAMRYILKHGAADISALAVNNYALILSAGFNDLRGSIQYGKLALQLADKYGDIGIKGRVEFVYGSFVNHWGGRLQDSVQYLERSQRYCLEAGNIHLAGASSSFIIISMLSQGAPLDQVFEKLRTQIKFINSIQYVISSGFLTEMKYWIEYLKGDNDELSWQMSEVMDDDSAKIIHYTIRLQMSCLFQKSDYAKEVIKELAPLVSNRLTLVIVPEYYFYHSLWLFRWMNTEKLDQDYAAKDIKKFMSKMKKWAALAPQNYGHKYLLLQAERRGMKDKRLNEETLKLYKKSVEMAEKNGFLQDAAIANECAAAYLQRRDFHHLAMPFLKHAYDLFKKWGAEVKCTQLAERYRDLQLDFSMQLRSSFDAMAAMEAARSLSEEIQLNNLSEKLMEIAVEYAGADRGILLYKTGESYYVGAYKSMDDADNKELPHVPIIGSGIVADSVINFVTASKETIILHHAFTEGLFIDDSYIKERQVKSLLCLPLLKKDKIAGILYLENNKAAYIFTEEKIKFLTVLVTQAAISIENAILYERMESKVAERTEQLQSAKENIENLFGKLENAEKIRKHFLSNITHDLRAPVSSVIGYLEAILDEAVTGEEEKRRFLTHALGRSKGLQTLINDIFHLAKMEEGQVPFHLDYISIERLMDYVYQKFSDDVKQRGIAFMLESNLTVEEKETYMIEIDLEKLEQVFVNLIGNAKNYTEEGYIKVIFEKEYKTEQLKIKVADTGCGISDVNLPYIFDRTFSKQTTILKQEGNGLGLAICREIIAYHKGEIWVESVEGEGTTFHIQLPLYQFKEEWV